MDYLLCPVDGDPVPVPHFGLALGVNQFHDLAERVQKAGIDFILEPHLRFKGDHRAFQERPQLAMLYQHASNSSHHTNCVRSLS